MRFKPYLALVIILLLAALNPGCSQEGQNGSAPPSSPAERKKLLPANDLVGKTVTDFPDTGLINQSETQFSFPGLPEKPVLLSFIYTRCPMSTMCPLITRKMKRVQSSLSERKNGSIHLVTVTFDPTHDTPAVLLNYAESRGASLDNWDFVTGPEATVNELVKTFKISKKKAKSGQFVHNLRTYLLDRDRVVRKWYRGSQWEVEDVVADVGELE